MKIIANTAPLSQKRSISPPQPYKAGMASLGGHQLELSSSRPESTMTDPAGTLFSLAVAPYPSLLWLTYSEQSEVPAEIVWLIY